MELKKQVCSLELAKKLKELGVAILENPKSHLGSYLYNTMSQIEWRYKHTFYWFHGDERIEKIKPSIIYVDKLYDFIEKEWHEKKYCDFYKYGHNSTISNCQHTWKYYNLSIAFTIAELGDMIPFTFNYVKSAVVPHQISIPTIKQSFKADTEANTRAKMLIWLIEDGHIKIEEK